MEVEAGYKGQHYHCSIHAADVLRTLHVLSTQGGVWHGTNCTEIGAWKVEQGRSPTEQGRSPTEQSVC